MLQKTNTTFPCTLCEHTSTTIGMALAHMDRGHGVIPDMNTYTCSRCRAPFQTAAEARAHVQKIHLTVAQRA